MTFSYFTFIHQPIASFAFLSLILGIISLWVHKRAWLWVTFLAIAFIFAFIGKLIDLKIFISLGILAAMHLFLTTEVKGWIRLIAILIATLFSFGLITHLIPGFHNWLLGSNLQISKDAFPYTLFLNFDKPFIGIFPLALTIPLISSRFHFRTVAAKTLALSAVGIMIMMVISLYLHIVDIDLKFPNITFIWLIANLFLVTIPEEAFFRGFLQREIHEYLQTKWSGPFSIIAVSLFFAVLHFGFVKDLNFISLSFVASLIYGTIYHVTRSIESSIFCHYLFNVIHFFCFTYPALKVAG